MIAQELPFFDATDLGTIFIESPPMGVPNAAGVD